MGMFVLLVEHFCSLIFVLEICEHVISDPGIACLGNSLIRRMIINHDSPVQTLSPVERLRFHALASSQDVSVYYSTSSTHLDLPYCRLFLASTSSSFNLPTSRDDSYHT